MPFKTKEEKRIYDMNYRIKNKDKIRIAKKIYNKSNREKINKRQRELKKIWRKDNKNFNEYNKEYMKEYNKHYHKNRKKIDPAYKIIVNLRTRLHHALQGKTKSSHTITLLGCTPKELRVHLEKQFTPGMTWKNYGYNGWHIDHIIPCSAFNLTNPEDQKKCFHFSNLQPLWKEDNFSKGSKY